RRDWRSASSPMISVSATDSITAHAFARRCQGTSLPWRWAMHELHAFFEPHVVAILGASADEDKLSGRPVRFMKETGFAGKLIPVDSRSAQIQGLQAYPDLESLDDDVDHAIIVLPAFAVE